MKKSILRNWTIHIKHKIINYCRCFATKDEISFVPSFVCLFVHTFIQYSFSLIFTYNINSEQVLGHQSRLIENIQNKQNKQTYKHLGRGSFIRFVKSITSYTLTSYKKQTHTHIPSSLAKVAISRMTPTMANDTMILDERTK